MDTGHGYFQQLQNDKVLETIKQVHEESNLPTITEAWNKFPKHGGIFYVGQNIQINDSKFRVLSITKKTMTLKLLPKP